MEHNVSKNTALISGVPRSGTTLCCKLLNQCTDVVALHEPLDPQKVAFSKRNLAVAEIKNQITELRANLLKGNAIEHGNKSSLVLDNPIAEEATTKTGIRNLSAIRGLITIPPVKKNTKVFIKQNAMFAALIHELKNEFNITAIIRNPIDVITSWMSVGLPVNKGRIPGGEKFDENLRSDLSSINSVLKRQVFIYHWFLKQFVSSGVTLLRYEDIIESKGQSLYDACDVKGKIDESMVRRFSHKPEFSDDLIAVVKVLNYELISPYYTSQEIEEALHRTINGLD
ncbi:hypothetical protein BM527_16620 [Alteromonas sp. Mex14]|nr:hypothetical protein BM527_16620 [Alteromonas sp. Mex14]